MLYLIPITFGVCTIAIDTTDNVALGFVGLGGFRCWVHEPHKLVPQRIRPWHEGSNVRGRRGRVKGDRDLAGDNPTGAILGGSHAILGSFSQVAHSTEDLTWGRFAGHLGNPTGSPWLTWAFSAIQPIGGFDGGVTVS